MLNIEKSLATYPEIRTITLQEIKKSEKYKNLAEEKPDVTSEKISKILPRLARGEAAIDVTSDHQLNLED